MSLCVLLLQYSNLSVYTLTACDQKPRIIYTEEFTVCLYFNLQLFISGEVDYVIWQNNEDRTL